MLDGIFLVIAGTSAAILLNLLFWDNSHELRRKMEYIEGDTLEYLMEKHPERADEYLDLFINIQREIHGKRSPLLTKFKDKMTDKMIKLRINEDSEGKTNLSLADVDGALLLVSQFTLYANCKKGNRPSFVDAGSPDHANALYEYIIEKCREKVPVVETGSFGAEMKVALVNDGPFTIVLDSDRL